MAVELKVGQKIKWAGIWDNGSVGTVIRVTKTFAEVDFVDETIKISLKKSLCYNSLKQVGDGGYQLYNKFSLIEESENI